MSENHAAVAYDLSAFSDGENVVGRQKRKIERLAFLRSADDHRFRTIKSGGGIVQRFFNRACVE